MSLLNSSPQIRLFTIIIFVSLVDGGIAEKLQKFPSIAEKRYTGCFPWGGHVVSCYPDFANAWLAITPRIEVISIPFRSEKGRTIGADAVVGNRTVVILFRVQRLLFRLKRYTGYFGFLSLSNHGKYQLRQKTSLVGRALASSAEF